MVTHTFSNRIIVLGQYYVNILAVGSFEQMMRMLDLPVTEYNVAIDELIGFVDSAKLKTGDSSKSQKLATALPKLYRLLKMINNSEVNKSKGVDEFQYKLDVTDLCVIPGHSHHQISKSVDVLINGLTFLQRSYDKMVAHFDEFSEECIKQAKANMKKDIADALGSQSEESAAAPVTEKENKQPTAKEKSNPQTEKTSFKVVVQKSKKAKPAKTTPKATTVKPKPTVPTALKPIRLWIGKGDLDITEKRIRTWSSNWKVHNNQLNIVQITKKSFVAEFQSRLRNFKVPAGVKSGTFRRKDPLLSYKDRKLATRWYVSGVCSDVSDDQVLEEIYKGFDNIDTELTVMRRLPAAKAQNCGNYCLDNRYWVKLVSQTNGEEPSRKADWTYPFKIKPWLNWKRQPSSSVRVDPDKSTPPEQSPASSVWSKTPSERDFIARTEMFPHHWEGKNRVKYGKKVTQTQR